MSGMPQQVGKGLLQEHGKRMMLALFPLFEALRLALSSKYESHFLETSARIRNTRLAAMRKPMSILNMALLP